MTPAFVTLDRGDTPLIVSFPHTGTDIPADIEQTLVSPWLARKDADWWIDKLYAFATDLGATTIRTTLSRTVIDVNRDPSGISLYPGVSATELCPTTTFDGEPLYRPGLEPTPDEIERRKAEYFQPYHDALRTEIERLRAKHSGVVLYEAHSIRSRVPRLFEGDLPNFNIGTNSGASCDPAITAGVEAACDASRFSRVTNGRFKGGYTTRHYGDPSRGVHAIQMELACRGYMHEPGEPSPENWPSPFDPDSATPMRVTLQAILQSCIAFAGTHA